MFWALALIAAFFSSYCLSAKFNCKDCVEYIPEVPLRMYSSYHVYGVTSVDSTKQTFGLDIEVQLKWNDSRIEFRESEWKPSFEKAKKRIWLPHFHVWQELNKQEILKIKLIKVNENITTVQMKSHLQIDVGCSMNFIDFPNDRQNCYFVMYDEDYNITEIIMETVVTSAKKFFHSFSNTNITVTPGDFTPYSNVSITGRETNEKNRMKRVLFKKDVQFPLSGLNLMITRNPQPYFWSYYLPSMGVVLIQSLAFIIPPKAIPGRTTLLITTVLLQMEVLKDAQVNIRMNYLLCHLTT